MRRAPQPLPREPLKRALLARIAADLPRLRSATPAPCRYPNVTLLLYYFPSEVTERAFDAFEFAIRQSWAVLGQLPTVVVTHQEGCVPVDCFEPGTVEVQVALMKVKEESKKVGLKLNIQKTKIMASGPITSWK